MNPCDIELHEHDDAADVPIEAVVAGTLCLMSCSMQSGSTLYMKKIVDNLDALASCSSLSCEMRRVCRRLAGHWQIKLDSSAATASPINSTSRLH